MERANGNLVRRRRTWYKRHLRRRRLLSISMLVLAIACAFALNVAHYFLRSPAIISQTTDDSFWGPARPQQLAALPVSAGKHLKYVARIEGVYPYSVVPGGVGSVQALREAAAADRSVARHFAHFDYDHARLVRLTAPRDVYVSYRIRNTIFWTRRMIRLKIGELLLTDGKITARAKCGNQVSDTAKPEVSNEEPEEDVLENPVALEPLGPSMPLRAFRGAPALPAGQPNAPPQLFAGNFAFPYVPYGLPLVPRNCAFVDGVLDKHCRPHRKPTTTPEPSTWIMLASGLALIGFGYFQRKAVLGI